MILDYVGEYSYSFNPSMAPGLLGFIMKMGTLLWLFVLVFNVLQIIGMGKLFQRFNKPGWASLIPLYNYYIMCEIVELPKYFVLLLIVPVANIYALYKIYDGICKKCEKPSWYTFAMLFFPYIFIPILGFNIDFSKNKNKDDNKEKEYVAPSFDSDFENPSVNSSIVQNFDFNNQDNINTQVQDNNINNQLINENVTNNISNNSFVTTSDVVNNNQTSEPETNPSLENELPSVSDVVNNNQTSEPETNPGLENELPSVSDVVNNNQTSEPETNPGLENELPSAGDVVNNVQVSEPETNPSLENELPNAGNVVKTSTPDYQQQNMENNTSQINTPGSTNPFIDNLIAQNMAKKQNDIISNEKAKEPKDFGMKNDLPEDNPFSPKPNNENIVSEEYY